MSVIDRTPESVYLRGYGQYQLVDLKLTAGEMAGLASVFTCPSGTLPARFGGAAAVSQLAAALPFTILAAPGALPVLEQGMAVGAIGIGGPAPQLCEVIATAALEGAGP